MKESRQRKDKPPAGADFGSVTVFRNSKRCPVTAKHPASQLVFARTSRVVGARGYVVIGSGYVDDSGLVRVRLGQLPGEPG